MLTSPSWCVANNAANQMQRCNWTCFGCATLLCWYDEWFVGTRCIMHSGYIQLDRGCLSLGQVARFLIDANRNIGWIICVCKWKSLTWHMNKLLSLASTSHWAHLITNSFGCVGYRAIFRFTLSGRMACITRINSRMYEYESNRNQIANGRKRICRT